MMGFPLLLKQLFIFGFFGCLIAQKDPHFAPNRTTIVHLFEWKWNDIASECENFLKDKGYGGIQISPPNENLVIYQNGQRPWWERYQPVSYKLVTRSGTRDELENMIKRCNNVGVRIYADAVFNHMTGMDGTGTDGSIANKQNYQYPNVPYGEGDFHSPHCSITNYQDRDNIQKCELSGLADLNQSKEYVREKIINYLNDLISLGVAGFRIDAAKHMAANDLKIIFNSINNLNRNYFPINTRPFIYQEVIDMGGEAVSRDEYTEIGIVTEFRYGTNIGELFQMMNNQKLKYLKNWGTQWGLMDGLNAIAFIENHDTERQTDTRVLNYKNSKKYKMAIAFMEAHPYGLTKILSSYKFNEHDQGPPTTNNDNNNDIASPEFNGNDECINNGWLCQHRWRQIYNMIGFRNTVLGTKLNDWWDNNDQQIAFSRGDKGFIAFTNYGDLNANIQSGLTEGYYCDIISGSLINGKCTGKIVHVNNNRIVNVNLGSNEDDGVLAIHINSKL